MRHTEQHPAEGDEPKAAAPDFRYRYRTVRVSLYPAAGGDRTDIRALRSIEPRFLDNGALGCVILTGLNLESIERFPVRSRWRIEAELKEFFAKDVPNKLCNYGLFEVRSNGFPSGSYSDMSEGHLVLVPC